MKQNFYTITIGTMIIVILLIILWRQKQKQDFYSDLILKPSMVFQKTIHDISNQMVANNDYVDVCITPNYNKKGFVVSAVFKNLRGVSAIHIHTIDSNEKPGPIIGWLCTSKEWQNGVKQNTPGSNSPGCRMDNKHCTLIAPEGTPSVSDIQYKTRVYSVKNDLLYNKSVFTTTNLILIVHGTNFQYISDGKLSSGVPGIDPIMATRFVKK